MSGELTNEIIAVSIALAFLVGMVIYLLYRRRRPEGNKT